MVVMVGSRGRAAGALAVERAGARAPAGAAVLPPAAVPAVGIMPVATVEGVRAAKVRWPGRAAPAVWAERRIQTEARCAAAKSATRSSSVAARPRADSARTLRRGRTARPPATEDGACAYSSTGRSTGDARSSARHHTRDVSRIGADAVSAEREARRRRARAAGAAVARIIDALRRGRSTAARDAQRAAAVGDADFAARARIPRAADLTGAAAHSSASAAPTAATAAGSS
jgi:hypothetical protein